jgi:hypothetical protein
MLYGRICMEWDVLGLGLRFPEEGLRAGDKILLARTGAYDMSMAYEFGRGKEAKTRQQIEATQIPSLTGRAESGVLEIAQQSRSKQEPITIETSASGLAVYCI